MLRLPVYRRTATSVAVAVALIVSLTLAASRAAAQEDPAAAQEAPPPAAQEDRGNWEFTLAGTGFSDKDFDTTTLGVDLGLGFFLGPIELGARQTINWTDTDVSDVLNGSTRGFADLQFDLGSVSPFIGVMLGYVYGDFVNEQFIAGPEAGIKFHVGDDRDTFIFFRVEYQFFFEDEDDAESSFDDGQFVYTIGVGFRF